MVEEANWNSMYFKDKQIEVRDYSTIHLALIEFRDDVGGMELLVPGPEQPITRALSGRGNCSPSVQNFPITLHSKTESCLFHFVHCT